MIFIFEMCISKKFKGGDLAKITLQNKQFTQDGFSTMGYHPAAGWAVLYEYINLQTYPSKNDFLGREVPVSEGQECIILNYCGRPWSIIETTRWELYDIYEVFIDGYTCYIFSFNLESVSGR